MACNTASTIALDVARAALAIPIVGVVPPIKPAAALTRTGVIGLLATPATVRRPYTDDLIARFAADKVVIRYGAPRLAAVAEQKLRDRPVDERVVADAVEHLFGAPGGAQIDVVALACTHFPLLRDELAAAAPQPCAWLDSGDAIARRVGALLARELGGGRVRARRALFTSPDPALYDAFAVRGFSAFGRVGPAPAFDAAPLTGAGFA
jgi:glutamate racemase